MSSNPFWDQQQQLFKMWNENMSKIPGVAAYADMYKNMMPGAANYWEQVSNMAAGMPNYWESVSKMMPGMENYWKAMSGMMPNMDVLNAMNPFNSMMNMSAFKLPGMDTYAKIFDLWKGMGDPVNFVRDFQQKYTDLMQDMFKNFLPAGAAEFMQKPQQLMETCMAFYKQIFQPWMQLDEDIIQRVSAGEPGAWRDFFRAFNERYDETFDKMFNMMGMGLNREANADYMQAISAYIKALFGTGELLSLLMDACQKSAKNLVEQYQKNLAAGKTVTTFREFYTLWYTVTEEALLGLFNTDEFSKAFGLFADRYSKYMSAMNKVYERQLAALPIPTNKDMKSLYQTVYDLRHDVRDLRRELDELKAAGAKK